MAPGRGTQDLELAQAIGANTDRIKALEDEVVSMGSKLHELHAWVRAILMRASPPQTRGRKLAKMSGQAAQWAAYGYAGATVAVRIIGALRPELREPLQGLLNLLSGLGGG